MRDEGRQGLSIYIYLFFFSSSGHHVDERDGIFSGLDFTGYLAPGAWAAAASVDAVVANGALWAKCTQ